MLKINRDKAEVIAQNKIRAWREKQFAENDVIIQNALVDGDTAVLEAARETRDILRDLPQQCVGKTVEELKQLMVDLGVI